MVTATGVLVGPVEDNDPDPTPEFRLTDEATGRTLNLVSGFVNLQDFASQRVIIEGVRVPGIDPNAFNVTSIRPADGPSQPPPKDECPVLSPTPELCDGGGSGGGSGTDGTKGGASSGGAGVAKILPKTGGEALSVAGIAGVLLIGGGLLVRRIFR